MSRRNFTVEQAIGSALAKEARRQNLVGLEETASSVVSAHLGGERSDDHKVALGWLIIDRLTDAMARIDGPLEVATGLQCRAGRIAPAISVQGGRQARRMEAERKFKGEAA